VVSTAIDGQEILIAAPGSSRAPFAFLLLGPAAGSEAIATLLLTGGGEPGSATDLRLARIVAGFPTLGAEIDDRTMPAEVDYDAIGGVAHDKGCYVGQETVARLHFRGHPNWLLRGLRYGSGSEPFEAEISHQGKPAVKVGTVARLREGGAIGLGRVRREVEPGTVLAAGDRSVEVIALPFPAG
jgi:folate-binding protein YgfZ